MPVIPTLFVTTFIFIFLYYRKLQVSLSSKWKQIFFDALNCTFLFLRVDTTLVKLTDLCRLIQINCSTTLIKNLFSSSKIPLEVREKSEIYNTCVDCDQSYRPQGLSVQFLFYHERNIAIVNLHLFPVSYISSSCM